MMLKRVVLTGLVLGLLSVSVGAVAGNAETSKGGSAGAESNKAGGNGADTTKRH